MESIQLGGRSVSGFGVGAPFPQSTYVKPANQIGGGALVSPVTQKLGAFVGSAILGGVAGVAGVALFGEGALTMAGAGQRLKRNWRVLAATATASGILGAATS